MAAADWGRIKLNPSKKDHATRINIGWSVKLRNSIEVAMASSKVVAAGYRWCQISLDALGGSQTQRWCQFHDD
jgi:hypothetical protein